MKLISIRIQNFRLCRDISLEMENITALVGANNSGKSSVLKAIEFLLSPSNKIINDEVFWNLDLTKEIRVEGCFTDLSEYERSELSAYLINDKFFLARSTQITSRSSDTDTDTDSTDEKKIRHFYKKLSPKVDWLRDEMITVDFIKQIWTSKESLIVDGISFYEFLNSSKLPSVTEWKNKLKEFVVLNAEKIEMIEEWVENPKGYPNVLKKTLPLFILVPAVRDVTEEVKGTRSTPLGRLINAMLEKVFYKEKASIEDALLQVSRKINRFGGEERIASISETERKISDSIHSFFSDCDLEIEFEAPNLSSLLSSPKLLINDGLRNSVENKGHGTQRAVIFSILRCYAEQTATLTSYKRSILFAIEEPELYMHPHAQRMIKSVLEAISNGGDQVIYSTHSALLVDVAKFHQVVRMEKVTSELDGKQITQCKAWRLSVEELLNDLKRRHPSKADNMTSESVLERYSSNYNPQRNEGFFASRIILVEGPTEQYCLPIYAEKLIKQSLDSIGVSVIECGGKRSIDYFYRVFNEIHIPCFILFDYDGGEDVCTSNELMELAGLNKQEPRNTLITENLACFPKDWEEQSQREITDYDDLTTKACLELGIKKESKPIVARHIAMHICTQTPPQIPTSIAQIINAALAAEWRGSCLRNNDL